MIDAVLSVHTNPLTCGVTKFNVQLADHLGVTHGILGQLFSHHPLVSIKGCEMPAYSGWPILNDYSLLLHDTNVQWTVIAKARRVFAANPAIARHVRDVRPDVITAWCPSTVNGCADRGSPHVLVFGMATKLQMRHLQALKTELDATHPNYTIGLSTAVHEGTPWDVTLQDSVAAMRELFGDRLRVLGFLGDDALAKELQDCDAVALYYDPAVRANNTTAWAVLEAGKTLWTNVDHDSPVLDAKAHSWDKLVDLIRA